MANQPIFVATHPRACSTAFERVFMTRRDTLQCCHEPFGDAWYFGPERLAERWANDEKAQQESGFAESTYKTIMDRINRENTEGKRLFIKDMAQYFMPPDRKPVSIAPSLIQPKRGIGTTNGHVEDGSHFDTQTEITNGDFNVKSRPYSTPTEPGNPTVVPLKLLKQFHFAFLIRHPKNSVPSYYRCCIPPQDEITNFYGFRSDEAGYAELRALFDYVRDQHVIGPDIAGRGGRDSPMEEDSDVTETHTEICVIDADDLLDDPVGIINAFCKSVGIEASDEMMNWDSPEEQDYARDAFEKWKGFHDDAINSQELKARQHKKTKTDEQYRAEWLETYGEEGAAIIQRTVDQNLEDYYYLKQYAIRA